MHLRVTPRSPHTIEGLKTLRLIAHEFPLLLRRQLHHTPSLVRSERREDLSANAEIRMAHMFLLQGRGKSQRKRSKFVSSHGSLIQNHAPLLRGSKGGEDP